MSAITWSVLSFFLGLLIGHWLALGRDKRKEFNDLAAPMRGWIVRQLAHPDSYLLTPPPSIAEVDAVAQRLSRLHRREFIRCWKAVVEAYDANSSMQGGRAVFSKTDVGLDLLRKLRRFTAPR